MVVMTDADLAYEAAPDEAFEGESSLPLFRKVVDAADRAAVGVPDWGYEERVVYETLFKGRGRSRGSLLDQYGGE